MLHSQNEKIIGTVPTAAIGSTATATLEIDRLGYDHVSIAVMRAANSATTFASVLKVEESADSGSGFSDVTALVGGGAGGFSIPAVSDTNSTATVKLDVDCKARKRYLKVSITPGATATLAISARLSRGEDSPTSASEAGVIGWVKG